MIHILPSKNYNVFRCDAAAAAVAAFCYCCNNCADVMSTLSLPLFGFVATKFLKIFIADVVVLSRTSFKKSRFSLSTFRIFLNLFGNCHIIANKILFDTIQIIYTPPHHSV